MSDDLQHIIKQAKKETQQEKIRAFFNDNKSCVIRSAIVLAAVIIAIIVIISVQSSRSKNFSKLVHQSLIYQQSGDFDKAQKTLEEVYSASFVPGGIKSIAMLRYAAFLLGDGKTKEAQKVYADLHDCSSCNEYNRDLAGLILVKIWMSDDEELAKEDLDDRIEDIEDSSSILKNHVAEQRAILNMIKGDFEESREIYEEILEEEDVFEQLKERAKDSIKILKEKSSEKEDS